MKRPFKGLYRLLYICTFLFHACTSPNVQKEYTTQIKSKDSIQRTVIGHVQDTIPHLTKTDSFLLCPFDLYKFKKKKGGSLGGGADGQSYFFKPGFKGFYWGYMMFGDGMGKGYIGKNKKDTVEMDNAIDIITYRPKEYGYSWDCPGEVLIRVIENCNDFDLPEMAFVGLDTTDVAKKLGSGYYVKDSCMVYSKNNVALILKINDWKKVGWLKYVLLKEALIKDNLPKGLLN